MKKVNTKFNLSPFQEMVIVTVDGHREYKIIMNVYEKYVKPCTDWRMN
jgi:hypothetical protein